MSKAYGYARISHIDGHRKGESVESQYARISAFYESKLKDDGIEWGGILDDGTNISAYRTAFALRPAGKKLLSMMNRGDHLVVDKVDRLWRSMADFVDLMRLLERKKITIHIVNFLGETISSTSAMGDFMLKMCVLMAELESSIKSERVREALAVKKAKGLRVGGKLPRGTKVHRITYSDERGTVKQLRWNPQERALMAHIVWLIDEMNFTWPEAYPQIEKYWADMEGRDERPVSEQRKDRQSTWRHMYMYETAYMYLKIREPQDIPKKAAIQEAARQYKRERTEERGRKSTIQPLSPEDILEVYC